MERKRKPAGVGRTNDKLVGLAGVIAARRRLDKHTTGEFSAISRDPSDRESNPESESDALTPGILITVRVEESGKDTAVYISQSEAKIHELDEDIQDKLPKNVIMQPLTPSTTYDTKPLPRLVDRIRGKGVGDTIELLNGKNAEIVEISFVDYKSREASDSVSSEPAR